MQVENKEFWEKANVIVSQDIAKKSSDFEVFMMEKAKEKAEESDRLKSAFLSKLPTRLLL